MWETKAWSSDWGVKANFVMGTNLTVALKLFLKCKIVVDLWWDYQFTQEHTTNTVIVNLIPLTTTAVAPINQFFYNSTYNYKLKYSFIWYMYTFNYVILQQKKAWCLQVNFTHIIYCVVVLHIIINMWFLIKYTEEKVWPLKNIAKPLAL